MEKDLKNILKEAKVAFGNREFDRSIQLCKDVLKADRDNYLALVFLGAAMQETDQILHAPKAFQKAVILKPNQILAWQGLAMYYEKEGVEKNFDHMVEVYENILSLERYHISKLLTISSGESLSDNSQCCIPNNFIDIYMLFHISL